MTQGKIYIESRCLIPLVCDIMYCKTCGVMVPEGRSSCPSCGTAISTYMDDGMGMSMGTGGDTYGGYGQQQYGAPPGTPYGTNRIVQEGIRKQKNRNIGYVLLIIGIILLPIAFLIIHIISWVFCIAGFALLLAGIITVATNLGNT